MVALTYLSVVLEGALAVRLMLAGLVRSFRWFTVYLLFLFARDLAALRFVRINTKFYEEVWSWSGILLLLLQGFVVFESYARARSQIPDLGKWARIFLRGICVLAALVVLATLGVDVRQPLHRSLTQAAYTLAQRDVGMALAIVAILSVAVFYPFRIRLRPNTIAHSVILAAYLGLNALIFGLMNLEWILRRSAGFAILITAIACYAAWIVRLSPAGEKIPPQPPPLSTEERENLIRREQALLAVEQLKRDLERRAARNPGGLR